MPILSFQAEITESDNTDNTIQDSGNNRVKKKLQHYQCYTEAEIHLLEETKTCIYLVFLSMMSESVPGRQ